jgi:hypothetical protein
MVALVVVGWLPAWAAPTGTLRLQLHTYEGIEFTCKVANGRVWYEFAGHKLAARALRASEVRDLETALKVQRFQELPPHMVQSSCDSRDTLTVWRAGKSKVVQATTAYGGSRAAEFKRFQSILQVIRRIAPVPGAQIEALRT